MVVIPDGKLELAHIQREAPPWRPDGAAKTECGRAVGKVTEFTDLVTAAKLVNKVGKKRAAMQLCIVCWETAGNWPRWEENPAAVLAREAGAYGGIYGMREDPALNNEIRAIAALIAAHPEQFTELVASYSSTVSLEGLRETRRREAIKQARRRPLGS